MVLPADGAAPDTPGSSEGPANVERDLGRINAAAIAAARYSPSPATFTIRWTVSETTFACAVSPRAASASASRDPA